MRPSPFEELAQRILEAQQRPPAIDQFLQEVYGIQMPRDPNVIYMDELEPGVVYGPPHQLSEQLQFAFALVCIGEIVVDR